MSYYYWLTTPMALSTKKLEIRMDIFPFFNVRTILMAKWMRWTHSYSRRWSVYIRGKLVRSFPSMLTAGLITWKPIWTMLYFDELINGTIIGCRIATSLTWVALISLFILIYSAVFMPALVRICIVRINSMICIVRINSITMELIYSH